METVIGKHKLSCLGGYKQIKKKNIDEPGLLDRFVNEGMSLFGVENKNSLERKIKKADLSQIEISAFNNLFLKYGVIVNIWEDVN